MKTCPHCTTGYPDSQTNCPTHGVLLNEIRDLKPGMVIHKTYRIVRKLGQGGMGTVYLAEHIHLSEKRALKFLSPELGQDKLFIDRFLREARTLRQVRSKNVVECGDLEAAEDDSLFFSMEFVDGPDLRDFLDSAPKPLDVQLALDIARGIAEGLGVAHATGMVHRDIKPENILMAHEGDRLVPKIADFGIAAVKESSTSFTRTGKAPLTMAYAAPEQWRGRRASELDGRTDLYALGCVLFEMLTGQTPFDGEDFFGWAEQHVNKAPQPPSALRPELANWRGLDALELALLAKDREQRPKDFAEVIKLIDAVVNVPSPLEHPATVPVSVEIDRHGNVRPDTVVEGHETQKERTAHPAAVPGTPGINVRSEDERPKGRVPAWVWVASVAVLVALAFGAVRLFEPKPPIPSQETRAQSTPATQPLEPKPEQNTSDDASVQKPLAHLQPTGPTPTQDTSQKPSIQKPVTPQASIATPRENPAKPVEKAETYAIESQAEALDKQGKSLQAAPLFGQACDGGDMRGCLYLGVMYQNKIGVEQDFPRAAALYTKACNGGNAMACNNLGYMYRNKLGLEQDLSRAVVLYSKACQGGAPQGCSNLGIAYRDGNGVGKDADKARQYLKQGCSLGDQQACKLLKPPLTIEQVNIQELETMSFNGGSQSREYYQEVAPVLDKACEGGKLEACDGLGELYFHGYVPNTSSADSHSQASTLFTKACDGGVAQACANLGTVYDQSPVIVASNQLDQANLFTKACDGGSAFGCYRIGLIYQFGKGVVRDKSQARQYLNKGCTLGNQRACDQLKQIQ